ncbi:MAG: hypothetical protein ACI9CE_001429 [Flavobacterium sp.]|jgi:hypothetical protein
MVISDDNIAQINIAQAKGDLESPFMSGFTNRLDEINKIADESAGFVWRLQDDDGNAASLRVFDDEFILVNMSVWETLENLKMFVYKTIHKELLKDKRNWFNKGLGLHQALWWIPKGHKPSVEEGKNKLAELEKSGPSDAVFTFANAKRSPTHL